MTNNVDTMIDLARQVCVRELRRAYQVSSISDHVSILGRWVLPLTAGVACELDRMIDCVPGEPISLGDYLKMLRVQLEADNQ